MIHGEEPHKPKPKATASVRVDKGAKSPFSFKGYELGEHCTLTLKGKVVSVSQDEYGSRLEIELSSGESENENGSMKEDMREMRKSKRIPGYKGEEE